jgi:hypothetical protein
MSIKTAPGCNLISGKKLSWQMDPPLLKRREGSPLPGKMSYPEWVSEKKGDLIVVMNDATTEQYGVYFIHQKGTSSCFQNIRDVIPMRGLCGTLYTDRGSHCRYTSEVGGKVGKTQLTHFGPPLHTPLCCESRFRLRFGNSHSAVKSGQIMYYKTEQLYWLATHA